MAKKTDHLRGRVSFKTTLSGEVRKRFMEQVEQREIREAELLRECVRKVLLPTTLKR
jgi:hypothetical protein